LLGICTFITWTSPIDFIYWYQPWIYLFSSLP